MRSRSIKTVILSLVLILGTAIIVLFGTGTEKVRADEEVLEFSKAKYTLTEGNEIQLNLIYNGEENFQDTYEFWSYGCFSSSDESVASVDMSGRVECEGTGKAVITAYYGSLTVKCNIKVKANKMKLSSTDEILYSRQSVSVSASGIKNVVASSCDIHRIDGGYEYSWEDMPIVESDYKGNFSITAGRSGDYRVRLIVENNKGTTYSKNFYLHTIEAGPESTDLSVVIGGKTEMGMLDSDILSVDLVRWYEEFSNYDNYPTDGDESGCPVKSDGVGGFSGVTPGTAIYKVSYEVSDGSILSTEVVVSAYEPGYVHFDKYFWIGSTYPAQFNNGRWNAHVTCESSDESIVAVNDRGEFVPMAGGKATLTVDIDGVKYVDDVEVLDVNIKGDNILAWVGTSFSFEVSGLPDGLKPVYSSSNPQVAAITKKGKLKVKAKGFTKVTVTIDGVEHSYTVNVGSQIPVKAALAAGEVVGHATYSQDRRMEEGYYDCSSLVWRSYSKAGLNLKDNTFAPTAADLAQFMEESGYTISYGPLPTSEMQPGDLLFTSSGYDNGRFMLIDHVAMYYSTEELYDMSDYYDYDDMYYGYYDPNADGKGHIVHAGSSGGGVYFSDYPYGSNIVMIARIKCD